MTRARVVRAIVVLAACVVIGPAARSAEARPASRVRGFAEFGTAGFAQPGNERYMQGGLRISRLAASEPCLDFSFAAWFVPGVVVTPDLDLAVPFAIGPGALLVPRAGVSTLLFGGGGFGGFVPGGNVGLGLVLAADRPVSVRADYTIRRFASRELEDDGDLHVLTVGLAW